jgi:hypothetical protein
MRIAQCVLCDRALKSGARSDCQFCGVRCRVRAHRLRQAKRSRSEQDDSGRITQQIAELEARLRSAEEQRQSDAVRHAQERGELQGKLQTAEERAAKLRDVAHAWRAQCKELEQASQVLQSALQQAHSMIVGMQHALQNRGDVPGQSECVQPRQRSWRSCVRNWQCRKRSLRMSSCGMKRWCLNGMCCGALASPAQLADRWTVTEKGNGAVLERRRLRSRKEELEQLLRGWRPERDMLVEVMRSQLAAEYALAQVKEGKTPLQRRQSPPIERDHEAMYRALEARKELAGKHGGASAWRYPNYELGLRLEMQLRNEQEARTERLKEEARKLQFVRTSCGKGVLAVGG